jgi:uncharacterized protein YndB with AHSA1/START domain
MTDNGLDLTISRHIAAPRALVWRAWVEPEHLVKWFCPAPWRAEVRAFDPRPGGAFEIAMHGPGGELHSEPGLFLDVEPERRIVFTSVLADGWRPTAPWLAMTAIVEMADEDGGTRYAARVLHKDAEDRKRHEEMGFHDGWGKCIDQLAALAAGGL